MAKILICDDEGIVQESLKFMIRKGFGNECEIESAKNGRTAIELAESFRPDVIFMDIQMPGINGIEAMQEIRKENKNVIFIVITAYDKFEYSQRSIDVGVMAYLTKPIGKDTVIDVLRKALAKVKERKEKARYDLKVKEKLEAVVPMIESGFIYSVLLEEAGEEEQATYRGLLDIETAHSYALVIECGDELRKGVLSNTVGAGIRLQKHYLIFREIIKEMTGGIVGALMANKVIVLVPCNEEEESYEERVAKIDNIRSLLRKLEQQTELKFKAGIGLVKQWGAATESYKEALEAVRQGVGKVTHAKDLSVGCIYEDNYPSELEKELFASISRGDEQNMRKCAIEFMEWLRETTKELNNVARLKVMEFVLFAEQTAYLQGAIVYRLEDRKEYLDIVMALQNYDELKVWFVEKMSAACRHVAMKQQEKTDNVVEKALSYIASHFSSDLSLETVAQQVNISPYYLSKLFKEAEGVNYIEYVTKLRIEYAKNELGYSQKSIKEICHESGYSDPNYFSRIFKKWTGLTPTEYREGGRTDV